MKTAYEMQLEQRVLAQDMRLRALEKTKWLDYEDEPYLKRWWRILLWWLS